MKKIVLVAMAMLTMTSAFAAGEKDGKMDAAKYAMEISMSKMSSTLGLTSAQYEDVANGELTFEEETRKAGYKKTEETRKAELKKALMRNIKYMRGVLDEKQYRKYLTILNVTLANRGLNY